MNPFSYGTIGWSGNFYTCLLSRIDFFGYFFQKNVINVFLFKNNAYICGVFE